MITIKREDPLEVKFSEITGFFFISDEFDGETLFLKISLANDSGFNAIDIRKK